MSKPVQYGTVSPLEARQMRDLFTAFGSIQVARAQWKLSSPKIWETSCFGLIRWVLVDLHIFCQTKLYEKNLVKL